MSSNDLNIEPERVKIRLIPTGVAGLDEILGGGLPEYSFNIIAGSPGGGKTTLAHQLMFANATPERPAVYFTILGEPAVKMLRYQQQFAFFDQKLLDGAIRFVNLTKLVLDSDLDGILANITQEIEASNPSVVVVDSFRTMIRKAQSTTGEPEIQGFIQRLAVHLTSWQATTFLIGEYRQDDVNYDPVFTVADGVLWLTQVTERNSVVRKMQIVKMRGCETVPGLHTFRISGEGVECFPRTFGLNSTPEHTKGTRRLSFGLPDLDALMGGGLPEGDSLLVAGPSGSGKTVLGQHFINEGICEGEPGIVAMFEELPGEYIQRAANFGIDLKTPLDSGALKVIYLRPLDLSVDETLHEIVKGVQEIGCKRLVIDSLVGFELALAPGFRTDFRESLYRMIGALTRMGVTILSTVEIEENFTSMSFSNFAVSFLADDLLRMRYVSINGQLRKMMVAVKMRRSGHSVDMHEYRITGNGISIGKSLRGFRGLLTGVPGPWSYASNDVPELIEEFSVDDDA